jgi:Lon protease-like protein
MGILEMEEENLEECWLNQAICLMLQLTLMAKKSRISAPKLQKALVGISRICESHLATYKVLKHYHSRIASGKQDLQSQRCFYMGDFRDLFFQ